MAKRVTICPGDLPLRALLSSTADVTHQTFASSSSSEDVAERSAQALKAGHAHVETSFISGAILAGARDAANAILCDARASSTQFQPVVAALDEFRAALIKATGRALLEEAELQLLGYKTGGSYRRHCDDAPGIRIGNTGRQVRRSLSLLLYLTDDDWDVQKDGGALRVFPPKGSSGGAPVDVAPLAGSLVVFDSASTPHEVLVTQRPRIVLAGWLQEERASSQLE